MMLRRLILPAAASMLLLTGCASEAVKGLSAGGRADTANFSIWIPNSLYKTEEPESALWDYSFLDRSGYMISVQDFDFGYAPADFIGGEYDPGEAEFEEGTLGAFTYCGWTKPDDTDCVLKFAAGTQGRLLFAQATVPEKKQERAKKQILNLLEHMTYIVKPIAPGSMTVGFVTVDYPETWAESAESSASIGVLHPTVNKDGTSVYITAIDDPKDSAEALAQERIDTTLESLPDFYSEAEVVQRKVCGYDASIARLCYGEPEDEDGCVIQESALIEAPQGICMISLYYSDPGAEEFLSALDTITLTFNGE